MHIVSFLQNYMCSYTQIRLGWLGRKTSTQTNKHSDQPVHQQKFISIFPGTLALELILDLHWEHVIFEMPRLSTVYH